MLQIQLLLSMIVLVVRIEFLYSSVCRLPSNRANGVAVLEGSPIRYNIRSFILQMGFPKLSLRCMGRYSMFLNEGRQLMCLPVCFSV